MGQTAKKETGSIGKYKDVFWSKPWDTEGGAYQILCVQELTGQKIGAVMHWRQSTEWFWEEFSAVDHW